MLAGSTRSVITTDPEMWEAHHLRHYAQTAVFSSTDRLRTFISGSPNITDSSCRAVTISQLRDLSDRGARSEAEALLFVSILGSVSRTTLLERSSVMASCRGCGDPILHFFDNIYDCGNFGCFGTSNGEAVRNAVKYLKLKAASCVCGCVCLWVSGCVCGSRFFSKNFLKRSKLL